VNPRLASVPLVGGTLVGLALAAAGCGSDSGSSAAASDENARVVEVRLVDAGCAPAKIDSASIKTRRAGQISFQLATGGLRAAPAQSPANDEADVTAAVNALRDGC